MKKSSARQRSARAWPILAFTSGFIDTVGFIVLFGLFTTHLTGNLAALGAQWTNGQGGMLAKILAVPVFLLVVACATVLLDRANNQLASLSGGFLAEALILVAFMLVGVGHAPFHHADEPVAVITGLLGIAAMAVRNALCKLHLARLPPTTVMTGNLTQLVVDLTRWLTHPGRSRRKAAFHSLRLLTPGLGAFMAGSLAGAGSQALFGFWAMWVPILCSLYLSQTAFHRARLRESRRQSLASIRPWAPTRILAQPRRPA